MSHYLRTNSSYKVFNKERGTFFPAILFLVVVALYMLVFYYFRVKLDVLKGRFSFVVFLPGVNQHCLGLLR